jgi:hypothetical protein
VYYYRLGVCEARKKNGEWVPLGYGPQFQENRGRYATRDDAITAGRLIRNIVFWNVAEYEGDPTSQSDNHWDDKGEVVYQCPEYLAYLDREKAAAEAEMERGRLWLKVAKEMPKAMVQEFAPEYRVIVQRGPVGVDDLGRPRGVRVSCRVEAVSLAGKKEDKMGTSFAPSDFWNSAGARLHRKFEEFWLYRIPKQGDRDKLWAVFPTIRLINRRMQEGTFVILAGGGPYDGFTPEYDPEYDKEDEG